MKYKAIYLVLTFPLTSVISNAPEKSTLGYYATTWKSGIWSQVFSPSCIFSSWPSKFCNCIIDIFIINHSTQVLWDDIFLDTSSCTSPKSSFFSLLSLLPCQLFSPQVAKPLCTHSFKCKISLGQKRGKEIFSCLCLPRYSRDHVTEECNENMGSLCSPIIHASIPG